MTLFSNLFMAVLASTAVLDMTAAHKADHDEPTSALVRRTNQRLQARSALSKCSSQLRKRSLDDYRLQRRAALIEEFNSIQGSKEQPKEERKTCKSHGKGKGEKGEQASSKNAPSGFTTIATSSATSEELASTTADGIAFPEVTVIPENDPNTCILTGEVTVGPYCTLIPISLATFQY